MKRELKDSGIPWIGLMPKEWDLVSVKNIFAITRGRVIATTELVDEGMYPVYSSQTKDEGCLGFINTYDYEKEALTWTTDGANAGTVFYRRGKFNCTNVCGILTPKLELHISMRFLSYSVGFSSFFSKRADINGYKIMSNEMASIKITFPPLPTQQRIANFLDRKCAEIDELATLQETMIAELKQYKQSVITEAVTKGLNKNVPMKDSGVEWIGEIPERWEVKYLSLLFSELKNKNSNLVEMNLLSLSYGKIIRKDITSKEGLLPQSFESYNIIDKNDIVFRLTDLQNDKKSLRTGLCPERGIITSAYITLRKRKELKSSFFYYLFHSYDICKVFYGLGDGVRQGMNYMDLKKLQILFPPLSTQQVIADYLDDKCAEIDELIAIKQQKLEALKEFKKSIIFEYVTGKKEVME